MSFEVLSPLLQVDIASNIEHEWRLIAMGKVLPSAATDQKMSSQSSSFLLLFAETTQ